VAVARALLNQPVLLAGVPASAVETAAGEQIGELLLELNLAGPTLILVTCGPGLAARYAHRVVRLVDGQITSDAADGGDPAQVPS
jgi:putative ABC transport system ATP-binding protein